MILITGANGQLGSVLAEQLKKKYGADHIIATDIKPNSDFYGHFEVLDATDFKALKSLVETYKVTQIYHMAAILSANGEQHPILTWDINMTTLFNVLEVARLQHVDKVFFPSSIAVYGSGAPKTNTPQKYATIPETVYGVSKVSGELWGHYYYEKYGLDVRSIRYPGVIGYQSLPGGGTTDYAVDIFHYAVRQEPFVCFLMDNTTLPMIYMDDAIRATIELMEAPKENIRVRTSYNIAGLSVNPDLLAKVIQSEYPDFSIIYQPDFRQDIADSWPESIDDTSARTDWQWLPRYDLKAIASDMIKQLKLQYKTQNI